MFTRRDLQRWHDGETEAAIVKALHEGQNPIDIYLSNPGRFRLEHVLDVLRKWAQLAGVWIVEGPRGSYTRWLQRMNLIRVTPRNLRRFLELLLVDPEIAERLRVHVATSAKNADRLPSRAEDRSA